MVAAATSPPIAASTMALLRSLLLQTQVTQQSSITSLSHARQLHAQFLKSTLSPFDQPILRVYSDLGLPIDADRFFCSLPSPTPLSWRTIIRFSSSRGRFHRSITFFLRMRESGLNPDGQIFPSVLRCCAALGDVKFGESLHGLGICLGLDTHLYTGNALLNMYCKFCGHFADGKRAGRNSGFGSDVCLKIGILMHMVYLQSAGKVFDMMPERDVVSWNTVIVGTAENGLHRGALAMVREMCFDGIKADSFTLSSILPIFAEFVDVKNGTAIHGYSIRHGFDSDVFIGSSLVDMYANCTRIEYSHRVFERLPNPDVISWNSVIAAFVQNGMFDGGLRMFRKMLEAGLNPLPATFSSIMPACAHLTTLHLGKQIHGYLIRRVFGDNIFIGSALLDMYAKCGNIQKARRIFDGMGVLDLVSWTAMIMGSDRLQPFWIGRRSLELFQ